MQEMFYYAWLGLIQGITEPLPISSSGHLVIFQHLFSSPMPGMTFEVFMNFASLLAVLCIYFQDLKHVSIQGWRYLRYRELQAKDDFLFIIYLVIATVPAAVIGLLFNKTISTFFKGTLTIGVSLILTGVALWFIQNLKGYKREQQITLKDALCIGFSQALALIPGISRSGSTIATAMILGIRQETALKFSFFLYIPVSIGGMILEFSHFWNDPSLETLWSAYLIAFLISFAASYIALKWFMHIMRHGQLRYFAYYCVILGTIVAVFMR